MDRVITGILDVGRSTKSKSSLSKELDIYGWLDFRAKEVFQKDKWVDLLSFTLGLNEAQTLLVNEFLERYGAIFTVDGTELNIMRSFSLSRKDDFAYVQVQHSHNHREMVVQYTITIMN